jgi:predicted Zn-dependent protease with MMP-like domain
MEALRMDKRLWQRLRSAAETEMRGLLQSLPRPIREQVDSLPIVFEPAPSPALVKDGLEPDLLGLFVGDAVDEEGADPVPPEILLFLGNIWEDAGHDPAEYREQVRTTLLHEIGHYLGLEEDDLIVRDLE